MIGKKGMELMISTAVIIVLAILVAVVLIIFWDMETGIFSNFINNILGTTNVDSIVIVCNSLAERSSVYDFCCSKKEVKYQEGSQIKKETFTCKELIDKQFTGGRITKLNCEGTAC